jgi:phosphatidylglycerol---prolipoprotein diacylglyceryl transferase
MYPNLYYAIKDWFGTGLPFLRFINSFGVFVAISFLVAAWVFTKELRRKEAAGEFDQELNKMKDGELPGDSVPVATIIAAAAGIIGAKIFGIFEYWNRFINHPSQFLLSANGLAFYGGLITATLTLWVYYRKKNITPMKVADAIAPALMTAYAIGRIGCHIAGDGDWGVVNPHAKPFAWLPDWLWAYDYPHNISQAGIYMPGCDWDVYCYQLPAPVYPTSLYETIAVMTLFTILWSVRKRTGIVGRLTALYLIFIAAERFFIEFIRVNIQYKIAGIYLTQAQLISLTLFVTGILLYLFAPRLKVNKA